MNKRTAQAFALGLLFSAISLWIGSGVIADKEPPPKVTVSNAKQLLETKGYTVMSSEELSKLTPKKDEKIAEKKEVAEKAETEEVKQEKKTTLVIAGGMSPGDVALMLKSQGIIDDESKFERYLIQQGFHTKVQIGTYELTNSMDYYQIAKVITKNR